MSIGCALIVLALAAVSAAVIVTRSQDDDERTDLQMAMAMAPDNGQRFSWTRWAGVRAELGLDLTGDSSPEDVAELLEVGFDADLTSTSALVASAEVMQESFGFSPATLEWELFTQSETGASIIMKPSVGTDVATIADRLRAIGYVEPPEPDGVWSSDANTVAVSAQVTPELAFLSLDAGAGLIIASDTSAGASAAIASAAADTSAALPAELVGAVGDPLSAALYSGAQVCGALAMANADPTEQNQADALIAQAGEVNPLTGFALAAEPGGGVRVAMSFESESLARTNADTRAALASGPAPGQGGDFSDRFALGAVTADGTVVTMDLEPVDGAYVVSDLSTGPVLFATC